MINPRNALSPIAQLVLGRPGLGHARCADTLIEQLETSNPVIVCARADWEVNCIASREDDWFEKAWILSYDPASQEPATRWLFDPLARIRDSDGNPEAEAVHIAGVLSRVWKKQKGDEWATAQRLVSALLLAAGIGGRSITDAWRWAVVMSGEPRVIFQQSDRWAAWNALINDSLNLTEDIRMVLFSAAEDMLSPFVHPMVQLHIQEAPIADGGTVFVPEKFVQTPNAKLVLCNLEGNLLTESFIHVITDAVIRADEDNAVNSGNPRSVRVADSAA